MQILNVMWNWPSTTLRLVQTGALGGMVILLSDHNMYVELLSPQSWMISKDVRERQCSYVPGPLWHWYHSLCPWWYLKGYSSCKHLFWVFDSSDTFLPAVPLMWVMRFSSLSCYFLPGVLFIQEERLGDLLLKSSQYAHQSWKLGPLWWKNKNLPHGHWINSNS